MNIVARALLVAGLCVHLAGFAADPDPTLVTTAAGAITGVAADDVVSYRGIRYAAPPTGPHRWAPPQPVAPWAGVLAADRAGPPCPQGPAVPQASEDCLYLNVWVPRRRGNEKLPVMFWSYGGGFVAGSGADPKFDGSALARRGVVVVTFSYRLGLLGYLAHPQLSAESPDRVSGNYGMLDLFAALQWVQANIAAFGGDPGRVTAFGESSGAMLLTNALLSPRARGLFQQVILQSGGQMREYHRLPAAEQLGARLGDVAALRTVAPAALPALSRLEGASFPRPLFRARMSGLIADGVLIPEQQRDAFEAGRFLAMPTLLGNNTDEGSYVTASYPVRTVDEYLGYTRAPAVFGRFADEALQLYPAATDADVKPAVAMGFSDVQYHAGTRGVARAIARSGQPVWRYLFTRRAGGTGAGPNHGDEVAYVFNTLARSDRLPFDDDDRRLAAAMADAWVRFATTGDPNGGSLPRWSRFDADQDNYLEFGDTIRPGAGYRTRELDFVSRVQPVLKLAP